MFNDNIHETKKVAIKYYFQDTSHRIIFVNTSNHALAEKDSNHDFWKREYVAWNKEVPINHGEKNRKETEKPYKRFELKKSRIQPNYHITFHKSKYFSKKQYEIP